MVLANNVGQLLVCATVGTPSLGMRRAGMSAFATHMRLLRQLTLVCCDTDIPVHLIPSTFVSYYQVLRTCQEQYLHFVLLNMQM